ncbi:MAG: aldehyde dehydrogenase family protein [Steroidobacteraceae bacterium]
MNHDSVSGTQPTPSGHGPGAAARAQLARNHRLLIDGEWREARSGHQLEVFDPATGSRIATVADAGDADIDDAVRSARRAHEARVWSGLPAEQRAKTLWRFADLLEANAQELAEVEVLDNGMPLGFAHWAISASASWLRHFAGMTSRVQGRTATLPGLAPSRTVHAYTLREPIGVAALIVPWNAPLGNMFIKLAPALAAGCCCIVKPAEDTPLNALRAGELALEAGIPPGVVNVVPGLGHVAGAALAGHPDVDKVSFTGSTMTGKQVVRAAAGNLKRVTLELGGKSPCVVCDDADLEIAIPAAAMGIFANTGQVCFAGSRLYAQSKVYDRVVEGIAAFAAQLRIGSGLDPATALGPVISARQQRRVLDYVAAGQTGGAELVCGGGTLPGDGFFVAPTIFANPGRDLSIVREEIFGPVLIVNRIDDLDEIVASANDTRYGLGAGVFTRDLDRAHALAARLQAGNVWVNCYGMTHPTMPFGGYKESGWGREMGEEGLDAFLETKSVFMNLRQ